MKRILAVLTLGAATSVEGAAGAAVGEPVNAKNAQVVKQAGKAKAAFAELLGQDLTSN